MTNRLKKFWKSLGPGFITGASDNDPSGIGTYTLVGARTGYSMLWVLIILIPFMYAIQEMCARIGALSGCGLAGNIKRHYPKWLLFLASLLIIIANTLNIGADILGMAGALNLLLPVKIEILAVIMSAIVVLMLVKLNYRQISSIFKWISLTMFVYLIAFIFIRGVDWMTLIKGSVIPYFHPSKENLILLFALLGTTVAPYLYFWQASEEAEETQENKPGIKVCKFREVSKNRLNEIEIDTKFGMFFSNFIAFFIVALSSASLFHSGAMGIESIDHAAQALRPFAGDYAYFLFTIGIISSGFLAIPVLAGSAAYVLAEIFGWEDGLDKKFSQAPQFYIVMLLSVAFGLFIPFIGISPIQALFYAALMHSMVAPLLIAMIIHMSNNPNIVGKNTTKPSINHLGYTSFLVMICTGITIIVL